MAIFGKKKDLTVDELIAALAGEIDHHNSKQIREAIDAELERGGYKLLTFDLESVSFMDSSGIGMVMGRYRKMSYLGGQTYVTGIGEGVDRIFSMSGLYRIIPKYQERTEKL